MLISDWSSDVCSSDLYCIGFSRAYARAVGLDEVQIAREVRAELEAQDAITGTRYEAFEPADPARVPPRYLAWTAVALALILAIGYGIWRTQFFTAPTDEEIALTEVPEATRPALRPGAVTAPMRSEEHTSELQSLMRISYAVFCLKKKKKQHDL